MANVAVPFRQWQRWYNEHTGLSLSFLPVGLIGEFVGMANVAVPFKQWQRWYREQAPGTARHARWVAQSEKEWREFHDDDVPADEYVPAELVEALRRSGPASALASSGAADP